MLKQMMKIAKARNKQDFLKMFPTEASFLKKHGGELFHMMYGGSFADGGAPQEIMQQPSPQQAGGQEEAMQQLVQFVIQALQQNIPEDQIIAKIVEMTGMPQDQAMQIIQMVEQKMGGEGGPQDQGGQEEMMEQEASQQPRMKMGGDSTGTYMNGVYFKNGGAYMPDYATYAYGGNYPMYDDGGDVCPPGYAWDGELEQCVKLPEGAPQPGTSQNAPAPQNAPAIANAPLSSNVAPRGGFNAGFGLEGNRYNLDYGFGVGADMKSDVRHNVNLNFPGMFRVGSNKGDLGIRGMYAPGKEWSGNVTAGFPLSGKKGRGDLLKFTGGMSQHFNDPELGAAMNPANDDYMKINQQKRNPVSYNAGLEYSGKMFGEKGPNVKLRASYDKQKYGGTPKYKKGGEYDMTQEEIQDLINKGYKIQYI